MVTSNNTGLDHGRIIPQANRIRDLRLLVLPMTMVFLLGAAGAGACLGADIFLVTLAPP